MYCICIKHLREELLSVPIHTGYKDCNSNYMVVVTSIAPVSNAPEINRWHTTINCRSVSAILCRSTVGNLTEHGRLYDEQVFFPWPSSICCVKATVLTLPEASIPLSL